VFAGWVSVTGIAFPTNVISVLTKNRWTADSLIVSGILTKGEASRLIDFYNVDPEREKQHQDEPTDEEKRNKLRELIKRLPVPERADFSASAGTYSPILFLHRASMRASPVCVKLL
jgi:hypothetical protein